MTERAVLLSLIGVIVALKWKFTPPDHAINGAKKTTWRNPYNGSRAAFPLFYYSKPGVYLIKSKSTGKIIYIGFSSYSVYKTLYRHFQTWNDPRQERFVYDKNKYLVRVILTTPKRAAQLESFLIKKYNPADNKNKTGNFEFKEIQEDEYSAMMADTTPAPF